jgi:hypothetical protein
MLKNVIARLSGKTVLVGLILMIMAGCTTHHYIVPSPIIRTYRDPLPIPAGFLMSRELRDQWFTTRGTRSRIDIPIGKVVLDFAHANLSEAFKRPETARETDVSPVATRDFYVIRYYDRRSQEGLLIKLNSIDFILEETTVYAELNFTVEDATGREIFTRDYYGKGTPEQGEGILQKTIYAQSNIELSTAAAMTMLYQELLDDIRDVVSPY